MIGLNVDKVIEGFRSELAGMRADIVGVRTDLAPLPDVLDELTTIRQLMEQLIRTGGENDSTFVARSLPAVEDCR